MASYLRHIQRNVSYALLLAASASLAASPAFAGSDLFPRRSHHQSETPDDLPPIYSAEPIAAPPVAEASPSAGGPLRVVIPNIKEQKARKSFKGAPAPASAVADKQAPAQATISETPAQSDVSALKKLSQDLYEKARDMWSNGVMIADWSNVPIIRTMFKPNIAFAPLPASWQVASAAPQKPADPNASVVLDTRAIAALAPAAGSAETINTTPPPPLVPAAQAPAAPAVSTATDPSEPAPELSSQSKKIIAKIPSSLADTKPEKPLKQKVDIDHAKNVETSIVSGPKVNNALGIKVGGTRSNMDVNYELERAYNALIAGKSDTAIQIYEDILTGQPKNKEALFGLASTYHRLGQIDIARSLYAKLLEIDPKNRDGLNNFLVLLADEAPQEALGQMQKLEDQNPGFSPIPAQMAIIYQKLGDQDKAIEKMYRALSIAPENITYRYNLAIMLDKGGKYEEAGKLYAQLLDSRAKGTVIPGDATKIQQRLTFIRSNMR